MMSCNINVQLASTRTGTILSSIFALRRIFAHATTVTALLAAAATAACILILLQPKKFQPLVFESGSNGRVFLLTHCKVLFSLKL